MDKDKKKKVSFVTMDENRNNSEIIGELLYRIRKIEHDVNIQKTIINDIKTLLSKIDKKTPLRVSGWFGDIKTYDD